MILFGHRGAAGHEPENTVLSVRKGIELGSDWIEVDVFCVKGELIVFHDRTLGRTTNGRGFLMWRSLDYLRSLDAGKGQKIPFLKEVVEALEGRVGLNIELKGPRTAEPVARFLDPYMAGTEVPRILVSSFDHAGLRRFCLLQNRIPVGYLYRKIRIADVTRAREAGAFSLHCALRAIRRPVVLKAHACGMKVFVFTVNEPDDIRRMADMGVDGIFSDYPDRVHRMRLEGRI
ncbi:glycerophosphodiester phosphodiesterase [bacterium]|nr:glycerophosphodiester phosphodiesterase [bacterium]